MVVQDNPSESLPRSHVFVTLSYRRSIRTLMIRSGFAVALGCLVPLAALWTVGSTLYFTFHDELLASLMLRERDMQYDYEDRIAVLRSQLDRATSRQLVSQRSVETKLQELIAREADLRTRSDVVARLADRAAHVSGLFPESKIAIGLGSADPAKASSSTAEDAGGSAQVAPESEAPAGGMPAPIRSVPSNTGGQASLPDAADGSPISVAKDGKPLLPDASRRLSELSTALDGDAASQEQRLATLDGSARARIARMRDALSDVGLSLNGQASARAAGASGGPFVPLPRDSDLTPFGRAASAAQLTLAEAEGLDAAVAHVPFSKPLRGDPEITSPFGPRVDPFLGRAAMHTGLDLREDYGTEVETTAPGRVTVAGSVNGYGTMVEIDHGAGLSTRYGHLSSVDVAVGQVVRCGDVIGRVGATGRATGPHLHYETRINGQPVDPMRFLLAGHRLLEQGRS